MSFFASKRGAVERSGAAERLEAGLVFYAGRHAQSGPVHTFEPQRLVDPLERQTLAAGLANVGRQHPIQCLGKRPELRQRLRSPHISLSATE